MLALALVSPSAAWAQLPDVSREQFDQTRTRSDAYALSQLAESGLPRANRALPPLGERRQAVFTNPYTRIGPVGVDLTRQADGVVTMTVAVQGRIVEEGRVPSASWDELMTLEGAVAPWKRVSYEAWLKIRAQDAKSPPPPPYNCHSWFLRLGAFNAQGFDQAGVNSCSTNEDGWLYTVAYGRVAASLRSQCRFDPSDPFLSVQNCYAPPEPKPN